MYLVEEFQVSLQYLAMVQMYIHQAVLSFLGVDLVAAAPLAPADEKK